MDYKDFCTAEQAQAYLEVTRLQMRLADAAREALVELVPGATLSRDPDERQYVRTEGGLYRMAMQPNSDNRTEKRAHEEAGAITVVMEDDDTMTAWFRAHGVRHGMLRWQAATRRKLGL